MHHDLKIKRAFFEAVLSGDKTFEVRDNRDRGFQKGDTFTLVEMSDMAPSSIESGRTASGAITYVLNYEQKEGFVVFAFKLDGPAKEQGHE